MPTITGTRHYDVRIHQTVTVEVTDEQLAKNRDTWFDDNGYATPDLDQFMCDAGTFSNEENERQLDDSLEYGYEPYPPLVEIAELDDQVPATGSLEGIACPRCGSTVSFQIQATTTVTMMDTGSDDNSGYDWDPNSPITCDACGHRGVVGGFQAQQTTTCGQCTKSVFIAKDSTLHHFGTDGDPMLGSNYVDHEADTDHTPLADLSI